MEKVEKARETFNVIEDGKAQNSTQEFNKGVNIVETDPAIEHISNQNEPLNRCEEESYVEPNPEVIVEITENSVAEDSGIVAPILQTDAGEIISKFKQNEEEKQESGEGQPPATDLLSKH